jgi:hypothetical protein
MSETMKLPKEAIDEFEKIFESHYKLKISDKEASEKANKVFNKIKLIYRPIPINENEKQIVYTNQ